MKVEDVKIDDIEIIENVRVYMKGVKMVELMSSIKQHGILQPIGVSETRAGKILVYGHRRLVACKKLGWKTIPAVIGTELELKDHLITNVTENMQRQDNSPLELGRIFTRLIKEAGMTKPEIATRLGVTQNVVKNALEVYGQVPAAMREKIIFLPRGINKNGNIAASTATLIMGMARKNGFDKATITNLMETTRTNELSKEDIKILGCFLNDGYSVKDAIKGLREYRSFSVDIVLNSKELDDRMKKTGGSVTEFLKKVVYGELPGVTRPSIVKGQ